VVGLGLMAVMSAIFTDSLVGLFQIASVWIISVTIAIATTGPVSGAHLNPAISLTFAWLRPSSFSWAKLIPYAIAQTAGAAAFTWVNLILYAGKIEAFEASNGIVRGTVDSIASARAFGEYFGDSVSTPVAFFAEAFGTALLAFVVFALTNPKNDTMKNKVFVPPLIGLHVGALIAGIAPLTQACFNPARDFGPRIVAYCGGWGRISFQGWWLYVLAPLVGAPIGAWIADTVLYGGDD
jgi:MIP family channel proteins